jgi:Zn-dependent protease with chaperone function
LIRFKLALLLAAMAMTASPIALHAQTSARPTGALPSLGDNSELAAAAERRIGDRIAASIYRDPDYIDDAVLTDYLQTIWQPLMAAARARGELNIELDERFAWELFLIRDRSVNAFALPGGYLGVHLGLIGAVSSRDELAAVLGHELTHVTQRHISRLITQQARTTPWMIGAMILGALAASKSPQAASAAMVGGQAVAAQSQLNFSRDMEREADRIGFNVMLDAGFEARGAAGMFEKLQQASRLNDNGAFPYLRSHPLTTQRIAEVQSRLQLASTETPPANPATQLAAAHARALHGMMAARAKVLADPGVDILRALLVQAQTTSAQINSAQITPGQGIISAGTLYAGALAAAKLRDFAAAQALAEKVIAITQGDRQAEAQAVLLQIEVDLLSGRVPPSFKTIDISKTSIRAELLTQSRALLAAGRPRDVSARLSTWVTDHPKDSGAWQLLAVAYGNQGQTVRAIRADAESHAVRLDYPAALDRLKAAQNIMRSNPASSDFMEGSIIDTRARQVQSLVKEQALQDKLDR